MTLCGITTTDTVRVYAWGAGVNSISLNGGKVKIYPTPTKEELHIDNIKALVSYKIMDIVGSEKLKGILPKTENTIDIKALASGVYILELRSNDGERVIQKLVKE
jgi:hypothetical protein